jgi:RNA polymerase primary sigma factor
MKSLVIQKRKTSRKSESLKTFETPEAEHECAMKAWNGDDRAKEELIKRNLRFVISCAKQYNVKGVSLEDLVNEGNIGITTAADRFDPTMGYKFISYAVWYIRKDIVMFLNSNSRTIKLPTNKLADVDKYKKRIDNLEQTLQRQVDKSDILSEYDEYTSDDVDLLNELSFNDTTSLDMPVGNDGDSTSLSELISDTSMGSADDLTIKSDMEVNLNALISSLTYHEKDIITRLYGLNGNTTETLSEVGDYYEVSRESIRKRRDKALRRIKVKLSRGSNKRDIFND